MSRHRVLTFISLPLLAIPAVAAADEPATVPPVEVADAVFPTMGPDGAASQLGAQVMFMSGEGEGDTLKRLDLNGQLVSPSGMGGYFTIGASAVDDEFALGSLELGALYHRPGNGATSFTARAGLILPTDQNNDGDWPLHLISTWLSRPSDYLTGAPETTTLRMAITPSTRSGDFVARADVGLDVVLDTPGEGPDSPFLHADVGAGFHNGKAGVLLELGTMAYLEEPDSLLHVIALTGELRAGRTTPYLTLSKPFVSGNDTDEFGVTNVALGMRGQL